MHDVLHWNCDSPDTREEGLRNKLLVPALSRILSSYLEEWLYHSHGRTGNKCLVKKQELSASWVCPLALTFPLWPRHLNPALWGAGSWALGVLMPPQTFPAPWPVTGSELDQQGCERHPQGLCVSREKKSGNSDATGPQQGPATSGSRGCSWLWECTGALSPFSLLDWPSVTCHTASPN